MRRIALLALLLVAPQVVFAQTKVIPLVGNSPWATGNPAPIVCISGCSGSGGTSSSFGAAFPTVGTAIGASNGTLMQPLLVDGSGNLKVNVITGGGGGSTFNAAFPSTGVAAGLSDGTNMKAWLAAIALADGVNGNNTAAVAQWLYNGTTWDRARGDATLGAWADIKGWGGVAVGAMANYGTSPGAVKVPGVNAFVTNTNANGQATMANSSPVVVASDQSAIPFTPSAGTSGGTTQYHLIAANTTNSVSVKGSAGVVYSIQTGNISASAPAYLKFYDKGTAPTCNTDTVVKTVLIPANSLGGGNNVSIPVGAGFASGIGICVTGGIADNDNTAVAAATVIINIGYK